MDHSSLCLIIFLHLLSPCLPSSLYQNNLFVQTCRLAAAELNETDCWVCAQMPPHQGVSFPLQAVPANATDLLMDHPGRPTHELDLSALEVQHTAAFPVCFQWPARPGAPDLGTTSRCQATISRTQEDPLVVSGPLPLDLSGPANLSLVSSSPSPRMYPLLTAACKVWKQLFAACSPIDSWGAHEDYFWICGHRAYKQLPSIWSGSCALGRVVPAIRVSRERPAGRIRNARDLQTSKDIVNTYTPLTDWELYLSSWLPAFGTVRVGWAVYRLQAIIELLTNDTAVTLNFIATEQRELRRLALQNRMALDMILASHGGVCALVGSECCVFVPDNSLEVFDHAKHIASLGAMEKDSSHDWLLQLKEWFGSWWGKLLAYLVGVIVMIVVLILCCKCIWFLVVKMCCTSTPAVHVMVNFNPALALYDYDCEQECDQIADFCRIELD